MPRARAIEERGAWIDERAEAEAEARAEAEAEAMESHRCWLLLLLLRSLAQVLPPS